MATWTTASLVALFGVLVLLSAVSAAPSIVAEQPQSFHWEANVTVRWQGVTGDTSSDWVSAWWVPFQATYVKYQNVTSTSGDGSATFSLLNARHPFYFRYYRGEQLLAQSNTVFPDGAFPLQIRTLFLTPDQDKDFSTSVRIAWTSNRTTARTVVAYGRSPDSLDTIVAADASTYTYDDLAALLSPPVPPIQNYSFANLSSRDIRCGFDCYLDNCSVLLFVDPGVFHSVVLRNLEPATKYYYRVGELGGTMSHTHYFHSRRLPGDVSSPMSVLYIADGGVGPALGELRGGAMHNDPPVNGADGVWRAIIADQATRRDEFALINGDISYARGWPWIWEMFHMQTEPFTRHIPVVVAFGNHEFDSALNPFAQANGHDSGGEAGLVTVRRFFLASREQPWNVLSYGPLTVVTLSSEHDLNAQAQFLETALAAVDRTVTPWLLVQLHRPVYCSDVPTDPLSLAIRAAYRDIFIRYGVDVVLTGHEHFYERLCAISGSDTCADSWGFRDVWRVSPATDLVPSAAADLQALVLKNLTVEECRYACATTPKRDSVCTAVVYRAEQRTCSLLQTLEGTTAVRREHSALHVLDRVPGSAPVYIVDGSAGAESSPLSTPASPLTRFKEFSTWGYSRLLLNATHLEWVHYHTDGSVVDSLTLAASNGRV